MDKVRTYEERLEKLTREELVAKVLNQRTEINNLHSAQKTYVHMCVWRGQIIKSAIEALEHRRIVSAQAILRQHVQNGDALLREIANGEE